MKSMETHFYCYSQFHLSNRQTMINYTGLKWNTMLLKFTHNHTKKNQNKKNTTGYLFPFPSLFSYSYSSLAKIYQHVYIWWSIHSVHSIVFISCHDMELFSETQITFFSSSLALSASPNYRPLNFKILFFIFRFPHKRR